MNTKLYIGFKGKNNTSCVLVKRLSQNPYMLTNSFAGLRKDIENLTGTYDCVLMFGIDKNLKDSVRIERVAEREGVRLLSDLDLDDISKSLNSAGVRNNISDNPTQYLCNEAYWFSLQKFNRKVVFIHIPSIKYANQELYEKVKVALC